MPPTDPTDRPADSAGGREARTGSSQTGTGGGSGAPEGSGKIDFGAFVSSRVKSSADRLKQGSGGRPSKPASTASDPASERPSTQQSTSRRRTAPNDPATSRSRPQRYWRDAVPGEENDDPGTAEPAADGANRRVTMDNQGGGGGAAGDWYRRNSEGRPWFGPALIAAAVVALLLLIFLLTRLGGGGGAPATPTSTSAPVIQGSTNPPTEKPVTQPAVTILPTETPRTGGDNQRRTNPAATGTPGVVGDVSTGCPERCLVRVSDAPQTATLLSDLGARPSFAGNGWKWVVATPGAIAKIENVDPAIVLVSDNADTLRLYAVNVPSDRDDDAAVRAFGVILDKVDRYRIVETESVPARAGPLTDTGYIVTKLTPGSSAQLKRTSDVPSLTSTDIGTLTPNVSTDILTTSVRTLQAMGAANGSTVGSRYYSLTGNQLAADYLFTQLESYGAKVWYEDFVTPDGFLLVNVVGELPGKDNLKIYGMMAHFDTTAAIPSVSPGADDNATGVAATLEIMRILSVYQLNHPVRAIFTNAEDSGLLGSDAWAKRALKEKTPIEGIFNIDSVGSTRKGATLILNGDQKSAWMTDLMSRVNESYGIGQSISALQSSAIVADDSYVRAQGIESIMIARELFGESPYHHTANDLIETVSIPYTVSATQVVLLSVASLVQ